MNLNFTENIELQNFDKFLPCIRLNDNYVLTIDFGEKFHTYHPLVYASIGSLIKRIAAIEGQVFYNGNSDAIKALKEKWGLENLISSQKNAESDGEIIPLTSIKNDKELEVFLQEIVPILHGSLDQAKPIRYVLSEMIRNVLEHSGDTYGATICCIYNRDTNKISIGIADMGIGVARSIARSHQVNSNASALALALTPGITGVTHVIGGNDYNAGAGLFFTRCISKFSGSSFVLCSSNAIYKLNEDIQDKILHPNPADEDHFLGEYENEWVGTLVGVDFCLSTNSEFDRLLNAIRQAYHIDVKTRKNNSYKKPRFI